MLKLIQGFAEQLKEAREIGKNAPISIYTQKFNNISQVVVVGLGGSAFGGEVIRNYVHSTCVVPISIYRGYDLPFHVRENTLVILSSYSGNTEETLSAANFALAQKANIVCISSGGEIKEWALQNNFLCIDLPKGYPPRTACGFSIVQQLFILHSLALIPNFSQDLNHSIELLTSFNEYESAKNIAYQLKDRLPIIYSSDAIDSVAIRLRQQINENAKQYCSHHVVPEMNHNELVGWALPKEILEQSAVIFLRSSYDNPRVSIRYDIMKNIFNQFTPVQFEIVAKGKSKLEQLLYLLHFGDWVSYYLAEANQVDPTPVKVIDYLKNELTKRNHK